MSPNQVVRKIQARDGIMKISAIIGVGK
jgi:hypothetical protein